VTAYAIAIQRRKLTWAPKLRVLQLDNARKVVFPHQAWEKVLPEIEKHGPDAYDFACWLRRSPLRPATVRAMTWEALESEDEDRWLYFIDGKIDKSKYHRAIPIEGELRRIVERRLKRRVPGLSLIFHREGRPIRDQWFRRDVFYPACELAKIPCGRDGGFTPYDAKRTAMKTHTRAGNRIEDGMPLSGHKSIETWKRYDFEDLDRIEQLREAERRTDAYLATLKGTERNAEVRPFAHSSHKTTQSR
jgi:hypothetical protein